MDTDPAWLALDHRRTHQWVPPPSLFSRPSATGVPSAAETDTAFQRARSPQIGPTTVQHLQSFPNNIMAFNDAVMLGSDAPMVKQSTNLPAAWQPYGTTQIGTYNAQPHAASNRTTSWIPDGTRTSSKVLDWEIVRPQIRAHYLDEGKTLQQTMALMNQNYGFGASEKMYKVKLKEWGFAKYNNGTNARWMLQHARKRKMQNKDTEYELGGQPISHAQIERSAKRSKAELSEMTVDTPLGITYYTPVQAADSPITAMEPRAVTSNTQTWEPEFSIAASKNRSPQRFWENHTRTELDEMEKEASILEQTGHSAEAEERYRTALSGLQHVLPTMHHDTITLARKFADFYANHGHISNGYVILQWLLESHVELWGSADFKTVTQTLQIVNTLSSWKRTADANSFLRRLLKSSISQLENAFSRSSFNEHDESNYEIVPIDQELAPMRSGAMESNSAAEELIKSIFQTCQQTPLAFPLQAKEICLSLGKTHKAKRDLADQHKMVSSARHIISAILQDTETSTDAVLDAAVVLVDQCIKAGEYELARNTARKVEASVRSKLDYEEISAVRILTRIGLHFQAADRWVDARGYFEHALTRAMTAHGLRCYCVQALEKALRNEYYDVR